MNLSVFTHGFYITINSVMHIISIVDVWRANSHVFLLVLTVQYLKITQKSLILSKAERGRPEGPTEQSVFNFFCHVGYFLGI